jgi:hypothetical protein
MRVSRVFCFLLLTVLVIAIEQPAAAIDAAEKPLEHLPSPNPENLVAKARLLYDRQLTALKLIDSQDVEVDSGHVTSSDRYFLRFAIARNNGPFDVDINVPESSGLPVQGFVMENAGKYVKLMLIISPVLASSTPAEFSVSFFRKQ